MLLVSAMLLPASVPASAATIPQSTGTVRPANPVAAITTPVTDLGATPAATQLNNLTLVLTPGTQQNAALAQLLTALQTPGNSQYHQWLTPQQFATQFGVPSTEVQQAQDWLVSQGFTVTATGTAGTWIRFSGTAAQLQSAFGVSLHNYSVNSVSGYANTNAPVIPSSLSSFVVGIAGLNTVAQGSSSKALTQAAYAATGWFAAAEFASLYDVTPLTSAGNTGSKEQIAVVGSEAVSPADIAAYRNAAGLAALTLSSSGTLPQTNNTGVATAELELAGGVAPGAQLIYYAAGSELDAAEIATDANASAVLLLSHIGCEAAYSSAEITAYQQMSQQAAAEGITVIAPAGDAGAAACDAGALYATQGLSVAFPASLPQVIAVGGTSLNGKTETAESAWNTLNDASYPAPLVLAGGGGSSSLFAKPAWQASTTSDSVRDVPDISLVADQMYPVCVGGSCSNGFANASGTAYAMQGTTAASASFAGVVALLAQQAGGTSGRLGNFAPLL